MQFYPGRSTPLNERVYRIRLLGVNDANPTKQEGDGVTITRVSEGLYKIAWASNPFQFIGVDNPSLMAATPGDLKGYTVVFEPYSTTAYTMQFTVYNASVTAADIIANQYLSFGVTFSESGV